MSKYLVGAVVTLLLVGALAGAYFLGKGQVSQLSSSASPQATIVSQSIAATPTPSPSGAQLEDTSPSSKTAMQIEAGIASKDYAAIGSYMTNPVNIILYASECCGPETPDKAVDQLDYLSSGTPPWNFKDNNPIGDQLIAKAPQYFSNDSIIGTASNKYAVGFKVNAQGKITDIILVADYELITKN